MEDKCISICDITECDVLAISTMVAKQISCSVKDADTLAFWADLITATGETLGMLAGQRARLENCKSKNT